MNRSDEVQTGVTDGDAHSTFTDEEVRVEGPESLGKALPTHSGQESVNAILRESQVVGGSDNTSLPAGANGDVVGDRGQLDRVTDSETAQDMFATEETADPGITSA